MCTDKAKVPHQTHLDINVQDLHNTCQL